MICLIEVAGNAGCTMISYWLLFTCIAFSSYVSHIIINAVIFLIPIMTIVMHAHISKVVTYNIHTWRFYWKLLEIKELKSILWTLLSNNEIIA